MKVTMLAESSLYFHWAISAPVMSTDVSQVGVTFFPSFNISYHFTFPGFPFLLTRNYIANIKCFKCGLGLKRGPPSLMRTIG